MRLVTSYVQTRCPSAALTAYTLPRESVTYMTPSTITGVVWLLTPSMTPCWKSQRGLSDLTFDVLIWSSDENRLPARSRLWSGQFTDAAAVGRCAWPCGSGVDASTTAMAPIP